MQTGAVADQNCEIQSEFCDFLSDLEDRNSVDISLLGFLDLGRADESIPVGELN